jgi:hypothetical protein
MREKTVIALYDHFADAKKAVAGIIAAGVPADRIALLANDSIGDHPALSINPAFAREEFDADSAAQSPVFLGAEVGVGLGGVLGFLAGVSTIAIPGLGFLLAAGTWATVVAGAAAGGVIGAVAGSLVRHGVSTADANLYAEGLKRGGTLLTCTVDEGKVAEASGIFKTHGAVDIEQRAADWTAEGWVSLDDGAVPPPLAGAAIPSAVQI